MAGVAGTLVFPAVKASDCVPQALTAGMPLAPGPSTSEAEPTGNRAPTLAQQPAKAN